MVRAALCFGLLVVLFGLAASDGVARPVADAAAPARCGGDSPPTVTLRPRRGPVGTRVRIRGRCFDPRHDYGILLIRQFSRPRECELIAGGRQRFDVDDDGNGRGFVVISRRGRCFQQSYGRRVTPSRYGVSIGCHACVVRSFRVTRR